TVQSASTSHQGMSRELRGSLSRILTMEQSQVESRQYPVSVHFNKKTNPNYLQETFRKVSKIHSTMPSGGILVFVTGRKEVLSLCKMLSEKFPFNDDCNDQPNSKTRDGKEESNKESAEESAADNPDAVRDETTTQ